MNRIYLTVEHDGRQAELGIPVLPSGITFGQYIDYRKAKERFFEIDEDIRNITGATHLLEALGYVIEGDLSIVPFVLPGDLDEKGFVPSIYKGVSLLRLDYHLSGVVNGYDPGSVDPGALKCEFEHNGKRFIIGRHLAKTWMTGMAFTAGEVSTVVEVDWLMDKIIEKNGDPQGSFVYERDLKVVAILSRQEGERLPASVNERVAFLEKRMKFFADLPMDIVLTVRFFLRSIYVESLRIIITVGSMKRRSLQYQTHLLKQQTPKSEPG